MPRQIYVNGQYVDEAKAVVSVFDRGFLFADGVYEVTAVLEGQLVDVKPHLQRLRQSLAKLEINLPMADDDLLELHHELMRRNGISNGVVYLQVTRGVAERDFAYPKDVPPTVIAFTQPRDFLNDPHAETGVSVITTPDLRWKRRDIKSIALLPQAMGKEEARRRGAYEAWMVEDGMVTEGTSSSAFIVNREGVIVTRALSTQILPGLTRTRLLTLIEEDGLPLEERAFSVEEAIGAKEAFLTSASNFVLAVVSIDGHKIGAGKPGPITSALRQRYLDFAQPPVSAGRV